MHKQSPWLAEDDMLATAQEPRKRMPCACACGLMLSLCVLKVHMLSYANATVYRAYACNFRVPVCTPARLPMCVRMKPAACVCGSGRRCVHEMADGAERTAEEKL